MRYQVEWEICQKKVLKWKLISVLFEILKDKDDYPDATMITREIKSLNPKPGLLSQIALTRFVFLAFEFITHISSWLFLCFLLIICNVWFVIELIWHASTSVFFFCWLCAKKLYLQYYDNKYLVLSSLSWCFSLIYWLADLLNEWVSK